MIYVQTDPDGNVMATVTCRVGALPPEHPRQTALARHAYRDADLAAMRLITARGTFAVRDVQPDAAQEPKEEKPSRKGA